MARQGTGTRTGRRRTALPDAARQGELEQLLGRIESGAIADVDELDERDLALLREYYGEGEELQALLDSLRGGDDR